jgi:hypothetical protein
MLMTAKPFLDMHDISFGIEFHTPIGIEGDGLDIQVLDGVTDLEHAVAWETTSRCSQR